MRNAKPVRAKHGEKTIEPTVRFFTDGISRAPGSISPRHALASGFVGVTPNQALGIRATRPGAALDSLLTLGGAVEKALMAVGIVLYQTETTLRYHATTPPKQPGARGGKRGRG